MASRALISFLMLSASGLVSVRARAHISLDSPKSRYYLSSGEADQSKLKFGPCGVSNDSRTTDPSLITTFTPGQKITVAWRETIQHPGHYEISFDDDGQDFPKPGETPAANSGVTLLAGNIADKNSADYTYDVTLPNVECSKCTLQLVQVMTTSPPPYKDSGDLYFQCADIVLKGSGAGGSGGTEAGGTAGTAGAQAGAGTAGGGGVNGGMGGVTSAGSAGTQAGMGGVSNGGVGGEPASAGMPGTTGGTAAAGAAAGGTLGAGGGAGAAATTGGVPTTSTGGLSTGTGGAAATTGGVPAGVAGSQSAGTPSSGAASPSDNAGCACGVAPSPRSSALSLFAAGLALSLFRVRRRGERRRVSRVRLKNRA